jgi:protein gp37
VSVGGESGVDARPCDYDWVLSLREQCVAHGIPCRFHQMGAHFIKDGKIYRVRRCNQLSQAKPCSSSVLRLFFDRLSKNNR